MKPRMRNRRQQGVSMIEVLVTLVILAFGLLGVAILQSKLQLGTIESFQRAQGVVLLQDMSARIAANPTNAASYVMSTPVGTGDSEPTDCGGLGSGAPRDLCEWSNALKGAGEMKGSNVVGAMTAGRGCVEQIQAPDPSKGVCRPGIYQVSVAWQGLHKTTPSSLACGSGQYGDDGNRRAIALRVVIGLPGCS